MELKGEYRITAPRDRVWAMLNDPAVLRECIPGCQSLEEAGDRGFSARVTTKIGPVKATFQGTVSLSNIDAPNSYTIGGEGKGGVAGFARGSADVHLAEDGVATVLTYSADAKVGGKLAQLGSRLIDSTAKKLADEFFACFAAKAAAEPRATPVAGDAVAAAVLDAPAALPGDTVPPAATGVPEVGVAAEAAPAPALEPASVTAASHPHSRLETMSEAAHDLEEEIELKAASGFLGGPVVWGLLVLAALIVFYVVVG